jgi:hypothetical protein
MDDEVIMSLCQGRLTERVVKTAPNIYGKYSNQSPLTPIDKQPAGPLLEVTKSFVHMDVCEAHVIVIV